MVQLPSGAVYAVYAQEVDYLLERAQRYADELKLTNVSDQQDLDRVMMMEVMCYRWGHWISTQRDWLGDPIDPDSTANQFQKISGELRQVKKLIGIDKVNRDRQRGEDSVSAYLANLLIRAQEFGVHRDRQVAKAIELLQQMFGLVTLWRNCDERDRDELHVTMEDIFDWIQTIAHPEFLAVDQAFRENQKIWLRSL